jgi:hypothetical protein
MPLTDRELFLARRVYETTLVMLHQTCRDSGMPGSVIIEALLKEAPADVTEKVRMAAEKFVKAYKPDA